jgi:small-conductance mechanosensitive channel
LLDELRPYLNQMPVNDLTASFALVVVLLVIRFLAGHAIRRRSDAAPHLQRRWIATIRNLLFFLGLIGLVLIWAPQLRTFAISLTAVAVAIVVATKELILCFSGAFMRASSRAFTVGDWIEVAGIRGEVVDHNIFTTTIHEFASGSFNYTGRTAVLPNSMFLSQPMRNDSQTREFAYNSFSLTIDPFVDIFKFRQEIEAIVADRYEPFRAEAARANRTIERRHSVDLMDDLSRVDFRTSDLGKYRIEIAVFCSTQLAESLKNDITCAVMSYLHKHVERHRENESEAEENPVGSHKPRPSS